MDEDTVQTDTETVIEPGDESAPAEELLEKNKQLYARVKKSDEERKLLRQKAEALEKQLAEAKKVETPEPKQEVSSASLERINLRLDGYSEEEAEFILRNGGQKAKNDEFVIAGIQSLRSKKEAAKKSEEASISEGSKSPILRKYSEQQLKDMPLKDLEQIVKQLPPQG